MRYLPALTVSALTVLLAACGSVTSPQQPPSQQRQLSPQQQSSSAQQSSTDAVTGTVTWPDGHLAANASVYFNNHDAGFSGSGWSQGQNGNWYEYQQLPADGSYSLPGCPCADLTAYLYVPGTPGAPAANGGWDCWIIMQDVSGTYSGRQAGPGDVINWQALDLPCSPIFYVSDPSVVQALPTQLDPSLNGGDYSAYAGTWQAAELRTSGG
jgi:hypothetical protein